MLISSNSGLYSARPGKPRYSMLEAVDFFKKVGFEAFDINFCATIYNENPKKPKEFILDGDWKKNVSEVKERCDKYGIAINTSHLPFFKYANKDSIPEYDFYQKMVYRSLEADAFLNVKWTVVHTAADPDVTYDYVRPLCEFATPLGLGIAIENTILPVDSVIESVDRLKRDGYLIGICYDTGHANVAELNQRETLHKIGDRLKMLHIHDNFGKDQHQPPFCGNINWTDVMEGLAEIGYDGDFNFEVNASKVPEDCRVEHAKYLISIAKHLFKIYDAKKATL